jgi:hypothetical protein
MRRRRVDERAARVAERSRGALDRRSTVATHGLKAILLIDRNTVGGRRRLAAWGGHPEREQAMCTVASGSRPKADRVDLPSSVRMDDLVALWKQQGHVVLGLTVLAHADLAAGALVGV